MLAPAQQILPGRAARRMLAGGRLLAAQFYRFEQSAAQLSLLTDQN